MQWLVWVLVLMASVLADESTPVARFPLQMTFNLTLTAHQVPEDIEYPPRVRSMGIFYDYIGKRGRADISEGYEAAKVHLRRYCDKKEYMVRLPPIDDCKRSNLLEIMPYPLIPDAEFIKQVECPSPVGKSIQNMGVCNYFLFKDYRTKVHMYFQANTGAPVQLIQETEEQEKGLDIPMLTYDYTDVVLGVPPDLAFDLAEHHSENGEPYSHDKCDLHVGGFPYLHIFHYFARF